MNNITDKLVKKLQTEKDFYYSWQANIAMAFFDKVSGSAKIKINSTLLQKISNQAAKNFLNLLIREHGELI